MVQSVYRAGQGRGNGSWEENKSRALAELVFYIYGIASNLIFHGRAGGEIGPGVT